MTHTHEQWPPMTMALSVTEDQLTGLTAGDRVSFSFRVEGGRGTIFSIKKIKIAMVKLAGTQCSAGYHPPAFYENHNSITQREWPLWAVDSTDQCYD
jgi:hypothetical protein